jgi:hypothetical protein
MLILFQPPFSASKFVARVGGSGLLKKAGEAGPSELLTPEASLHALLFALQSSEN